MLEIRATRQPAYWGDDIEFRILDRESRSFVKHIEMVNAETGSIIPVAFQLPPETAQSLMNSLWDCGLRPSEGTGSAGAMAATVKHLEDMRKIVFGFLKDKI